MRSTLVYDLPTRLFHGLFAILFLLSFTIAKTTDDESLLFSYHMLSGIVLAGLVLWRIIWGLIGSRHAKFSGFDLNPLNLKEYFLGILSGSKKRWTGHNPASSWAATIMFILALGLAITGYMMTTGYKESVEDTHEFMANAFITVVILHVAGIILHSLRHQDGIALSMIDGKKETSNLTTTQIISARPFAAVVLLTLVVSSAAYLYKNFNPQNRILTLLGQTLQLGENENEKSEHHQETNAESADKINDDHDGDED